MRSCTQTTWDQGTRGHSRSKQVVFWVGLVHGILFISYAVVAFWAWRIRQLNGKLLMLAAVASIVPLGPFFIDRRLKAAEQPPPDTAEVRG